MFSDKDRKSVLDKQLKDKLPPQHKLFYFSYSKIICPVFFLTKPQFIVLLFYFSILSKNTIYIQQRLRYISLPLVQS